MSEKKMSVEVLIPSVIETIELNSTNASVAVLLPTYCEAENIERLIRQIMQLDQSLSIVVIDDSSPDGTAEIVKKLQTAYSKLYLVSRKGKLGLGTAITTGFRFAISLNPPPDFIITMDSDYSHNPRDIPRLLKSAKNGNGVVIGSRYVKGGHIKNWPLKRRLISQSANVIGTLVIGKRIRDCTSGFRCYSRNYVADVINTLHSATYEIQIETLKQARLKQFTVKEIPITFRDRKKGTSKLSKGEIKGFLTYAIKSIFCKLANPIQTKQSGR
jgi:dolichol-phosphate mannosyltransferase